MPPNTCSDAKKTRKQKHQIGNHLRSNNDALYNLELLRLLSGRDRLHWYSHDLPHGRYQFLS